METKNVGIRQKFWNETNVGDKKMFEWRRKMLGCKKCWEGDKNAGDKCLDGDKMLATKMLGINVCKETKLLG